MKTKKPAPIPRQSPSAKAPADDFDLMEATRRIMGRLAETPHKPHTPIGKAKGRPAPKGNAGKGKMQP